jgi:hypothetical protein
MLNTLQLLLLACATSTILLGAECQSVIRVNEQHKNDQVRISAKNTSRSPIIAYVIAGGGRSMDGSPTNVYSGVYSGRDALFPGKSIELDVHQGAAIPLNLIVDYVRLANGLSCGKATTETAKTVATRVYER